MFSTQDLAVLASRNISLAEVETQLNNFRNGFPYLQLAQPATVGQGILQLTSEERDAFLQRYERELPTQKVVKFVPASGAASRMFKALFAFMKLCEESEQSPHLDEHSMAKTFLEGIRKFAFFQTLAQSLGGEEQVEKYIHAGDYAPIFQHLLTERGMNYGKLPKGLLEFHAYEDATRTPAEEHLVEGAQVCADEAGKVRLHFTVSPHHLEAFKAHLIAKGPQYEQAYQVSFDLSYSIQKPATDTLAVDMEDQPFRKADGELLFRPGGHGALIENLNELDADLVFIKNIDNVVPDHLKGETVIYKKVIGGVLLSMQQQIFDYLEKLDKDAVALEEVQNFLETQLCVRLPQSYDGFSEEEKKAYLQQKLHRPIRVCGMVKNEGEPGGGPFWVKNADGSISLQIAEKAQIDPKDEGQQKFVQGATHFNPVDLVCGLKDRNGNAFDLTAHRDPQTGFISFKSLNGRELKAQELPGLWNGAMADWNTLFVEVPLITFNPVKTVNDLLRPQHQGE